jgi:hypothetical protein
VSAGRSVLDLDSAHVRDALGILQNPVDGNLGNIRQPPSALACCTRASVMKHETWATMGVGILNNLRSSFLSKASASDDLDAELYDW